jgi:hypothetical protein
MAARLLTVQPTNSNHNNIPLILTPKDVGDLLGLPKDQVYRLFRSKSFPSERVNNKHIITKMRFLKWLGSDGN